MKEVSNGTLVLMIIGAIIISVVGTMVSLNKLNQLGGITGMASNTNTQTGTANLTVPSSTYINLTDSVIQLGTVEVEQWNSSDQANDWWVVQNDGSVNISIQIYDAQDQPSQALNPNKAEEGIGPFATKSTSGLCIGAGSTHTCFMIKCNSTKIDFSNGPGTGTWCNNTYYPLPLTSGVRFFIKDLVPDNDRDEAVFGVNVTVPPGEPAGVKNQTVTFLATAS